MVRVRSTSDHPVVQSSKNQSLAPHTCEIEQINADQSQDEQTDKNIRTSAQLPRLQELEILRGIRS
jgi:hypothetical protein